MSHELNNIEDVISKIEGVKISHFPESNNNIYINTINQVITGTKHLNIDTLRVNLQYDNNEEYKMIEQALLHYIDMGYIFTCYNHYNYIEILIDNILRKQDNV